MYFCIFCKTNENEVVTVQLTALTVRMALRSLKAAGFSVQVETINTSWHRMNCWDPNINFGKKKKKKLSECLHPLIS